MEITINLRPTLLSKTTYFETKEDVYEYVGFGLSGAIGTAFRWRMLNIGVEYVLGNIKCTEVASDEASVDEKLHTNNLRIKFGLKF